MFNLILNTKNIKEGHKGNEKRKRKIDKANIKHIAKMQTNNHINNIKYKVTKPSTQRQRLLDRFNVRKREAVGRGEEEVSGGERRRGERGGEGRRRERRREGKEEKGRGGERQRKQTH